MEQWHQLSTSIPVPDGIAGLRLLSNSSNKRNRFSISINSFDVDSDSEDDAEGKEGNSREEMEEMQQIKLTAAEEMDRLLQLYITISPQFRH